MDENEKRRRRREMRTARRAVFVVLATMIMMVVVVIISTIVVNVRQNNLLKKMETLEYRLAQLEEKQSQMTVNVEPEPALPENEPVVPETEVKEEPAETEETIATEETEVETEETETEEEYSPDTVNYLAIGNSITRHQLSDYWWGDWGMAASTEENDYFHLVKQKLKEKHGKVSAKSFNFYAWEPQASDRAEALMLLDNYLSEDLDYVSIQLGENVSDTTTFEGDFDELVRYIQTRAPKAKIVIIGNFWTDNTVDELKMRVAIRYSLPCIDLAEIRDNAAYQCGMGTVVYDAAGNPHQVTHEGTAKHPNDAAMAYIADKVFSAMETFDPVAAQAALAPAA